MRFATLTTADIDSALDTLLLEGVSKACIRHKARPGRYVLVAGEELIPTKVVLAQASGKACSTFSGGFATTIGVLQRLGFAIFDTKTGSVCPPRKVRDAARRVSTEIRARPAPCMPATCKAYYLSGTNRAPEIKGAAAGGHAIGLSAAEVSYASEQALSTLVGTGIQVFVDSGAFSEVSFKTGAPVIVNPISHDRWIQILELYARLGAMLGSQLTVVAPDMVGHQKETIERLRKYRGRLEQLADLGVRVLVPVQKGEISQLDFWRTAHAELAGVHTATPALPCNKSATTPEEAATFRAGYVGRIHLLGVGPRSRSFSEYVAAMGDDDFTCDSCWIGSVTGRTNGPKNGPRVFTAAKDAAKAMLASSSTTITSMTALIAALTVAL